MDKSKDKILSEDSNVINPDLNPEVVGIDEEDKNAVILEQVEESHSSNIDDFNSSAEINIEKNNQITCSVNDELQEDTTQMNIVSNNSNGEVELQNIETVSEHSDELQPHEEYTKLDLPTTVKDVVELNDKNVVISDQASSDAEVTQLDCNVEGKLQRVEILGQINCDDEKESEVECNLDNQSDRVVENIDDIISETEKCDNLEMIPEQKFSEDTNSSVKEVSLDARTENSADIDCSENNDLFQKDSDKVSPSNPEINDDLVQHHITEELSNKIPSEDNEEETLCSEKLSENDKISKQEIKINDSEDPVDSKTENIVEVEKSGEMGQLKIESTTDPSTSDLKNQISAEIAFLEKQAEAEFEMEDKETNLGSKHSESDESESEQKGDNYIDISQFLINFESINMTEENDKNDEHSSMIKDMESDDLSTKFEDIQQHMREGEQSCSDNEDTELCGISLEVEDFEDKISCKEEEFSYEPEFAVAAPQTKQPEFDNDETSTLEPVSQENNEKKSIKAEDLKAECDTGIDSLANFEVIDEIADEKNVQSKDVELPQKEITKNQSEEASKSSEVKDVIPKRSKIIKITLDDLPKSSKSSKILEIPGEEIDGGEFTRVVIIGSTYLSTYSDTWPADSKIKPFFIGKNDLSIQQYYTEFCHHPYLTGSKKIFVLFVIGLNDILIFKKYKARNCMEDHQEIKFPRSGKLFTLEYVKILVAKMKHIKKKLESNESLSVSFAYIPKVNFIEVINNLFLTSHKQYENCLCNYVVTKGDYAPINAQFNLGRETMNQFIFSKQLNKVRDKGFFEFLPMHLSYTDRKWIVHNERVATKIDGMSLDARLNNFIFPPASKEVIVPSKAVDDDFALAMDQLLGKMYFRVLIIGDSWLLPIMESWSSNTKIKPFFYCKNNLTLEETKDIILSVVKDESSTLVITTVPSGDLFKLESYYECEDHTPLLYPVPKKGICEAPLKYAHQLCKKVDLFQTEIRKLRKHCKVVFMTCYPVDFKMYYKYLTELHETETKPIKHSICRKLVDFNECKMYKIKVKICLKALNSHLVEVNMENGLHTCDIYSLSYKLNIQDKFMFPAYVPNLSPPNEVVKKLTIIIKRYVENVHILYQKRKFSFHHIMDIMDSKNKMDEHNIPKQNANEVSDSKDPVPDKVSKSDKTQKSSIKMKEISKEDTHKEKSVEKLPGKVSKSKHPSDSASHKGAECIVKSLTCSSHHKAQERAGTARYPEKFYEAKHSSQKLEPHYHKNKERYSEKPPNEAKYPSDRYSQKSVVQSKRIPQEVRYPLSDAFEEDILEADRYKYKEFYRGRLSPPKDYRRGQDYRHSWKGSSRSRSPGRRPRSRTPRRYRSPSPSPRYRSKSPSSKRRRSRSPSRSKYSRDKRKRSKSYSPHKSSKRDRHASAKEEAVSDLWEIHSRECEIYRRNPEAHPDYDKVKRMWYEVMSSQGLNPYDVNLEVHWQEYWVKKMEIIFNNNWEDKKTKCLSLISSKARRRSRSSSSSSRSSYSDHDSRKSGKHRHKKKAKSKKPKSKKKSKRNSSPSDSHARSKDKNLEHSLSLGRDQSLVSVEELESRINAFMMKTRPGGSSIGTTSMDTLLPSMSASQMIPGPSKTMSEDTKLVDVTTILSQISDRFGALGMSLSVLHKKIVDAIKNGQNPLQCIDEDAKMLLELIGDKIKRLLGDCNLTLVQRTIIQEAHDRLMPFLESLEKKNQPNFGLDLDDIAKSTLGMQVSKIVNFIKGALTYKKVYDISNEDLMKIYVDVKAAQMNYVMQTPAPPSVPSITKSLDTPSLERPAISNFFPSFSLSGTITQPPPNYTPQAEVKQTRSAEIKNNFLSLSMNEKLKKFATFNTLPYEEKSFLLSHLDELEKTDKVLAQSLRFMMMQNH